MARNLGDVLHWFSPELEQGTEDRGSDARWARATPAVRLVGVPVAPADPVRAALVWNLAVELARQGARSALVSPASLAIAPALQPEGTGPLGVEIRRTDRDEPAALAQLASEVAKRLASRGRGLVLSALPLAWLAKGADLAPLLRSTWSLLRPGDEESHETWSALEAVASQAPGAQLGATVFGVRRVDEARACFERLARVAERRLDRELVSYGMLAEDVHLSRALVTGRPVVLTRPQTASSRALADVARLLLEDACSAVDA